MAFTKPYFEQNFDYFNNLEKPAITLCNPDHTELYSLNACYDTEVKLYWNTQSEFNFTYPRFADGVELDAFDYIEGKRHVHVDNIGYFIISDVQDDFDGAVPIKSVSCLSQESELVYKRLSLLEGTYSLSELMDVILDLAPGWALSYLDSSFDDTYRTFNVADTNVYQFLTTDVASTFNCVVIFEYEDKNISIVPNDLSPDDTDIFLSFSNLIERTSYNEITEEVTTCLYCYGGGNLTIASVNPLGSNAIYNFTYYKSTDWMTQALIDAIDAWETKITSYQDTYEALLVSLSEYQATLLTQQATLATYEEKLAEYEQVLAAREAAGLDTSEQEVQIEYYQGLIADQNIVIGSTTTSIAEIVSDLSDINDALDIESTDNFTFEQFLELSNFIFENTYRNDAIIITDSMTFSEEQAQAQELYNDAVQVLEKISVPRYQVTIDLVNFLSLIEYLPFIEQLTLGDQITIDTERGYFIQATLLEYSFSYDNPEQFEITISNQQRLDDAHFIFTDLIGYSYQQGQTIGFNSANWNDWSSSKDQVLGNVYTPSGTLVYGLIGSNVKGTLTANTTLAITNTNSLTGSSNFTLDHSGATLRDATLYSGSNLGVDGSIVTAGGGTLFFRGGIYVGGTGTTGSALLYFIEDCTGQTGSIITLSYTFLEDSTRVYLNGLSQRKGYSYSEGGDVESIVVDDGVLTDDAIVVEYIPLT